MAAILTDNPVSASIGNAGSGVKAEDVSPVVQAAGDLGVWLSGLESFLRIGHFVYHQTADRAEDASRDLRIVESGIRHCALASSFLLSDLGEDELEEIPGRSDLAGLHSTLGDAILVCQALHETASINRAQWRVISDMLASRISASPAVVRLVRLAENSWMTPLPEPLRALYNEGTKVTRETAEIVLIVPRFGRVLRWLSVVGKMLKNDEPLKPTLLIFSNVNELIVDLTRYINGRLGSFPDQEAELFATLDAASYTASIELKKVYAQELAGIADMRPAPSIYARVETAHSLLNDGFQQILAGITRVLHPEVDVVDLFPEFQSKLERSIILRQDLWSAANKVRAAEKKPEAAEIEEMQQVLRRFMNGSMRDLFYKDTETVERFIEEILVTSQTKDLVPLLHRFGAYLDTLFGQVSLRAVLATRPFDPS